MDIENMRPFAENVFLAFGIIYFFLSIIDMIRWWNGSDENGDPK